MEPKEIEELVDSVYSIVGKNYIEDFKTILGGCHVFPPTEWLGDIYSVFKKILKDNVIQDILIIAKMHSYMDYYLKWFK